MTGSYDGRVIGERFGMDRAPTVLARTASVAPIGFTRLKSDAAGDLRAKDVPFERAYSLHVALRPTVVDLWVDGKHCLGRQVTTGESFLFDLGSNPVSELHAPFDILRFYISQASIDELSCERDARGSTGLAPKLGAIDTVMHGLAVALADSVETPSERSALFIDHIGLAFHAHVTETYGEQRARPVQDRGGLAPWQVRRALDFMHANLEGDPTVAQLAGLCGLSADHFARAFRQSTGTTPHQWLMARRVAKARALMLGSERALAEIAAACGFVDQSHFNRVFARIEGLSPGRWRRLHGGRG